MVMSKTSMEILPGAGSDQDGCAIRLTITATASSLDTGLHLLQQFLRERLSERGTKYLTLALPSLTINLGILGTRDFGEGADPTPDWKGRAVFPLRLSRSQALFGPLFIPGQPQVPCPYCLERRWFSNLQQSEQRSLMYAQQLLVYGHNPRLTPFVLESIWLRLDTILGHLQGETQPEQMAYPFYALHLETQRLTRYHLLQDANCPVCANATPDTREAARLELVSRPKRNESSYRLQGVASYALPLSGLVNPVAGMLGPQATTNPVNVLVPVGGSFQIREKYHVREAWWRGHGHTEQQGLFLGLLEGIERYAGHVPRGKQTCIVDSYTRLAPDALDPRECGLYQPAFYEKNAPFYQPFTEERPMPWVWGYSFRQQRPLLVPEQLVYYVNYGSEYPSMVQDCSSGCAIGSCLEEAMFYGLLELIERDAFLITWYARLAHPAIDARSSRRPETLFLLEGIEKRGYDCFLFDTRLDISIPTVLGVAHLKKPGPGNLMLTAGCSFDPEEAIHKTLCEIASHAFSFPEIASARLAEMRALAQDFSLVKGMAETGLLFGLPEMARHADFLFENATVRTIEETYRDWETKRPRRRDLLDDLRFCMEAVFKLGLDVIVVDQTCPEQVASGLKTVCVIVPGLMPMDFGWERDRVLDLPRLRTVPRTTGHRSRDFIPDARQIIPHPFP